MVEGKLYIIIFENAALKYFPVYTLTPEGRELAIETSVSKGHKLIFDREMNVAYRVATEIHKLISKRVNEVLRDAETSGKLDMGKLELLLAPN